MVRLTDRSDMTLDVYHGRKTTIQQRLHSVFFEWGLVGRAMGARWAMVNMMA